MADKATSVYRVLAHRNIRFKSLLNSNLYLVCHKQPTTTSQNINLLNTQKILCLGTEYWYKISKNESELFQK